MCNAFRWLNVVGDWLLLMLLLRWVDLRENEKKICFIARFEEKWSRFPREFHATSCSLIVPWRRTLAQLAPRVKTATTYRLILKSFLSKQIFCLLRRPLKCLILFLGLRRVKISRENFKMFSLDPAWFIFDRRLRKMIFCREREIYEKADLRRD